jgi:uncharacterized coiled-coil DUF342 family protein
MAWIDIIELTTVGFTIMGVFIIQRTQARAHLLMYQRQVNLRERILEMQNQVIQEHNRMTELWQSWAKFRDEADK